MSDELFEVAFSGQIVDGTNPEEVKTRIRKMFKADDAKVATLFSGNRVIIKKNIDQPTAVKYKAALFQAGAVCEIISMSAGGAAASPAPAQQAGEVPALPSAQKSEEVPASPSAQKSEPAPASTETPDVSIETGDWGEVEPPPQVDPLGITGDQIEDLDATVAPVGSPILDKIEDMPEPQFDLSEFDIAPVGSDLGSAKKEPDPPPPDTTGITMAD